MENKGDFSRNFFIQSCKSLNYLCVLLLIVDVVMRVMIFKQQDHIFFFLFTIYEFLLAFILAFAEFEVRRVLFYGRFLSFRWGKGLLLLFISLLIFDENSTNEFLIGFIVLGVGAFNVLAGVIIRDEKSAEEGLD